MSASRAVILVTGANRGIGLAIIQSLATHSQVSSSTLLLGCRDVSKGNTAISELRESIPNLDTSKIHPIEIDVTSDASIRGAVEIIQTTYGHLDALINNAGYASVAKATDYSDVRPSFSDIFSINVTSVYMTTTLFLPLLKNSPNQRSKVINISSARGSLTRSSLGQLPPTAVIAYSVSKTALNALTLEMSRAPENAGVEFQLACPGYCKTAFNGYRGTRDPLEGAGVVTELVVSDRRELGYWETVGADRTLREVPW